MATWTQRFSAILDALTDPVSLAPAKRAEIARCLIHPAAKLEDAEILRIVPAAPRVVVRNEAGEVIGTGGVDRAAMTNEQRAQVIVSRWLDAGPDRLLSVKATVRLVLRIEAQPQSNAVLATADATADANFT